jgi:PPK2 family polyphosphate:nucleotide phosphotransferase
MKKKKQKKSDRKAKSDSSPQVPELSLKQIIERSSALSRPYRITDGRKFALKDIDPADTAEFGLEDKPRAREALAMGVRALAELQDVLYANRQWSLLLIFQAMDAAGKDGAIKHVMSGVNPQGCQVASFKAPSSEDLDHDYLWRCQKHLPERGRIGIFNRSYYEEVLVVRVHPEILENQRLPQALVGKDVWEERYQDIRAFERHLSRNGTLIRKFFLHVSKDEQKRRFLARLEDSAKNWKFSPADMKERGFWDAYAESYQNMIRETSSKESPWYVVPADNKWYTRIIVAAAVIDALASLDLRYPEVSQKTLEKLAAAKQQLLEQED